MSRRACRNTKQRMLAEAVAALEMMVRRAGRQGSRGAGELRRPTSTRAAERAVTGMGKALGQWE